MPKQILFPVMGYDSWSGTAYYETIQGSRVGMKLIDIEKHKSSPGPEFILEFIEKQ